jgi:prepilin-type N-terminal cleavage/methylation domain-containing protein
MVIFRILRLLNKKQLGFTLIELLIVLGITTVVASATTATIFQILDGNVRSNNHMDAISSAQNAGCQISRDIEMAQIVEWTDDDDGFPLTLIWNDWESDDQHQVVYSIVNNRLQREHSYNGSSDIRVFEYILSTDPDTGELKTYLNKPEDEDDYMLSLTLTAIVGTGSQKQTETRVYEAIPRPKM